MQKISSVLAIAGVLTACSLASGQQQSGGRRATAKSSTGTDLVSRMMKFDKNKDGKLTRSEVSDTRMRRLFDRADADKDGVVTKDELTTLAANEPTNARGGPGGFGPGGPGGFGPGGPGGFGPPRMGQILPGFMQERLSLTATQKKQVADLQKEVDAKLAKILSAEQNDQLKEMQERGPGGGPPGFGGPGGPPPGGFPPGGPPPDGGDGASPSAPRSVQVTADSALRTRSLTLEPPRAGDRDRSRNARLRGHPRSSRPFSC